MNFLRQHLTETRLLILGLIAVLLFAVGAAIFGEKPSGSATSTRNAAPNGARALRLWLEESDYTVRELTNPDLDPDEVDVLFVLSPRYAYDDADLETLQAWVRAGNTLIIAGDDSTIPEVNEILQIFQVQLDYMDYGNQPPYDQTAPLLMAPPFGDLEADSAYYIQSDRGDLVMHLTRNQLPVVASFSEGEGRVWVLGTVTPFTNRGLSDEASARMILNFLPGTAPADTVIGFDEGLHGLGELPATLSLWLRTTPAGWSILSAFLLTVVFLTVRGRRFGRAVPPREERLLREPIEYIRAMATLLRRSGQRLDTLEHYQIQLRRALAKRYVVDPGLDDDALIKQIARRDRTVDTNELYALFFLLRKKQVSEVELVRIASEVDEMIRRLR